MPAYPILWLKRSPAIANGQRWIATFTGRMLS
jgi:hypothetical protein